MAMNRKKGVAILLIVIFAGASFTAWSYSQSPAIVSQSTPLPPVYYPSYLNTTVAGNNVSYIVYEGSLQSQGMKMPYSVVGHATSWTFQISLLSEKKVNRLESVGIRVPAIHLKIINDSSHKEEQIPVLGGYSPSVKVSLNRLSATMNFAVPQNINNMAMNPGNYTINFNVTLNLVALVGPYQVSSTSPAVQGNFPLYIDERTI